MALLDLLERQPPIALHEVDEPEIARAEDHNLAVRDIRLRLLRRLAPRGLADRLLDHRVLLVAARDAGRALARERSRDELLERVPVALLERGALRLPVIGQDDDLVRARRVAARTREATELLVELAQRLQRVRAHEP